MLDFTSALYLGLSHPSASLEPWDQLTTGRPAALLTSRSQTVLAEALAKLVGCERASLGSSTLHLFWDLFGMLDRRHAIYMDAGVYPIGRWGVERAAARRIPIQVFSHYDSGALRASLQQSARQRLRPVVVADGFCPGCGQPAPIAAYLQLIHQRGGLLILDDTQALGILGDSPYTETPLGSGGGGSLRFHNVSPPNVLLISSLAKAFGAPLAMLAGSDVMVRTFEEKSETRMHTSPPSRAAIHAARRALQINSSHGEVLRSRLARLIRRFCRRLAEIRLQTTGGSFPVQTLRPLPEIDAEALHRQLLRIGIQTVLHRRREAEKPRISFLLNARHVASEIDGAVAALRDAIGIPKRDGLRIVDGSYNHAKHSPKPKRNSNFV
jgi:8-amino-7-oxononanoate synthase